MAQRPDAMPPAAPPVALTIAGSDPSGGAGIQADLKTFAMLGVYGASVLTALTAQNTTGVQHAWILNPQVITRQLESVAGDLPIAATKTGMLGTAENIAAVAEGVRRYRLAPLVVDPVMVAKSGHSLIDDAAVASLCEALLPLAAIVTPNRFEAARMLGLTERLDDAAGAAAAARAICQRFGARACVVKGIRRREGAQELAVDVWFDGQDVHEMMRPWHADKGTHGSGCTFSAALTAVLARGQPLREALRTAKVVIDAAIAQGSDVGRGMSPVNHLAAQNAVRAARS